MRPAGYYTLTAPIANPTPDRRKRDDWRALPIIPAGTEFRLLPELRDAGVVGGEFTATEVLTYRVRGQRYDILHRAGPQHPLYELLDAAPMAVRTPTLAERLDAREICAEDVLDFLGVSDAVLDAVSARVNAPTPIPEPAS